MAVGAEFNQTVAVLNPDAVPSSNVYDEAVSSLLRQILLELIAIRQLLQIADGQIPISDSPPPNPIAG